MRSNNFINKIANSHFTVILTVIATLSLITVRYIAYPQTIPTHVKFGLFTDLVSQLSIMPYVKMMLDSSFIILFAFLFNHADTRFNIIRVRSSFPFFMTALLLTTNNFILGNIGESISTLLILFAISSLFSSYQLVRGEKQAFDISLLLSLASLFWIKSLYLIPVFWVGMYIMKTLNIKSLAASLIGVLAPYWFAFFLYSYLQNYSPLIDYFQTIFTFSLVNLNDVQLYTWIHLIITVVATIISIGHTIFSTFTDKIRTRSYLNFLFILLIASVILIVLDFQECGTIIYLTYLICAFLLAQFFASVRGRFPSYLFYTLFYSYLLIYIWSLS